MSRKKIQIRPKWQELIWRNHLKGSYWVYGFLATALLLYAWNPSLIPFDLEKREEVIVIYLLLAVTGYQSLIYFSQMIAEISRRFFLKLNLSHFRSVFSIKLKDGKFKFLDRTQELFSFPIKHLKKIILYQHKEYKMLVEDSGYEFVLKNLDKLDYNEELLRKRRWEDCIKVEDNCIFIDSTIIGSSKQNKKFKEFIEKLVNENSIEYQDVDLLCEWEFRIVAVAFFMLIHGMAVAKIYGVTSKHFQMLWRTLF